MPKMALPVFVLTATLVVSGSAAGDETTAWISGQVTDVPIQLASDFQAGMPISGFISYDPDLAFGENLGTITEFQATIGDYTLQQTSNIRGDIVMSSADYTAVSLAAGETINANFPMLMALQFSDASSADTPAAFPPAPEKWNSPLWTFDFQGADGAIRVTGAVDSISTVAVPEPWGAGLLAGFLAIPLWGRHFQRRRPGMRTQTPNQAL